ncbi:hypothetical protein ACS0TY_014701 [Phlomoides rotata]
MSDEGEKTCPLCAEEMDLTDQQLKPCKCGYEICVWCWHHIMDMAEKDNTEGRCPACRTPYNKEKIVATTASCGRLVSEMNVEKKVRSSKGKNKSSEARKQLASVRVIQRNLVYVVGLPLNFADEDLLQRREYFNQYGKVLKVSISKTASGAIQHFANSTCSVYITYSKEEEAVRCIQSVHGFVLDGKPLRACFGTTKYCHAWLRNMPCSNPDCLYLHEIGSQEDSFTKDEIISAYTRVQQITGSSNSTQRRSGNLLPPPVDEYCNNTFASSGKPINKTAVNTNDFPVGAKVSPPNSSSGRSAALPTGASWGARASNNQPLHTNTNCLNGPFKKPDVRDAHMACSSAAVSQSQLSSFQCDAGKMLPPKEESTSSQNESNAEALESVGKESNVDGRITFSGSSFESVCPANLPVNRKPHGPPTTKQPPNSINIVDSSLFSDRLASDKDSAMNGSIENICADILSMGIHENQILENGHVEHFREKVTSQASGATANTSEELIFNDVQSDYRSGIPSQVTKSDLDDIEDDLLSFNNQRLKDPEVATNRTLDYSHASHHMGHPNINSPEFTKADASVSSHFDNQVLDNTSNIPIGHPENILKSSEVNDANFFSSKDKRLPGRYEGDMGESSIISDIFSIDFDPWDESLTSPQNLAKLLGENDKQGSFAVSGSRKVQNSNQSRFSFAREEETMSQLSGFGQSIDYFAKGINQSPFGHEVSNSNNLHLEQFDGRNGFPVLNGMESEIFAGSHSVSSNRLSASRSQVSAPPGFSVPFRSPPPGFTSHDRTDQVLDSISGNHFFDASSMLRYNYQTPSSGNTISNGDIEFMDPAILAVGKGTLPGSINGSGLDLRSNYSSHLSTYEEARFQSFLQRSLPSHQNQRFPDIGESFSPLGDAYRVPSRVMEQPLANNISPFSQYTLSQSRNGVISNGQWDGWNGVQPGNNMGMGELMRTERLGFNKFYGSYEDSKIRMPSSGNLYNGTYGI